MPVTRGYFSALDSWRGICACMVALGHFSVYNHLFDMPIFWNAGYYVDFFFALSGFVIFSNYQTKLHAGFGINRFILIRFGRIYPLHFLTLAFFVLHELLKWILSSTEGQAFVAPGARPADILINLTLLHSFNLIGAYSFNSPSWSISAEFYTYILFAFLLAKVYEWKSLWLSAAIAMGFIYFEFFDGKEATHDGGLLRCVYGFAVGGLCWILWEKYQQRMLRLITRKWAWTTLEVVTVGVALYLINALGNTILVSITPFVFAALIYVFAFEMGQISALLSHRYLLLLGVLSYSIYMIHAFISWKIINSMVDVFYHFSSFQITTVINGQRRLAVERWQGDLLTVIYLSVIITLSCFTYKIFEMPCRDYIKKRVERLYQQRS